MPEVLPRSNARRGFSLVELLVVIGVIAIIAGMTIPAMSHFGRGAGLSGGGTMIANLAAYARQEAMTRSTMTALLMLEDQGTPEDYRVFCVLGYKDGEGWSPITNWERLADGIIVDFADAKNNSFITKSPGPFPFVPSVYNPTDPPAKYQGAQVRTCAYRVFMPHGGLRNPEVPAKLRLVEGVMSGKAVKYTHPGTKGEPANYMDIAVIGATGSTKLTRP